MASTTGTAPGTDLLDPVAAARRRAGWDAVMSRFLPGSGDLETALFTAAEAVCGGPPNAALDLGGGPGGLADRMSRRWPGATVALLDLDPVLLAIARAALPGTVPVLTGDLAGPDWPAAVAGHGPFDVVTVVMTLHYLPPDRALAVYRDARRVLAPGGLLVVADVMPDDDLPSVMAAAWPGAGDPAAERAWTRWWHDLAGDRAFDTLLRRRRAVLGGREPAEFTGTTAWHRDAARRAGFAEAGVLWRWGPHAALAALAGGGDRVSTARSG
jgi:SAM-dependent methyltransferase